MYACMHAGPLCAYSCFRFKPIIMYFVACILLCDAAACSATRRITIVALWLWYPEATQVCTMLQIDAMLTTGMH